MENANISDEGPRMTEAERIETARLLQQLERGSTYQSFPPFKPNPRPTAGAVPKSIAGKRRVEDPEEGSAASYSPRARNEAENVFPFSPDSAPTNLTEIQKDMSKLGFQLPRPDRAAERAPAGTSHIHYTSSRVAREATSTVATIANNPFYLEGSTLVEEASIFSQEARNPRLPPRTHRSNDSEEYTHFYNGYTGRQFVDRHGNLMYDRYGRPTYHVVTSDDFNFERDWVEVRRRSLDGEEDRIARCGAPGSIRSAKGRCLTAVTVISVIIIGSIALYLALGPKSYEGPVNRRPTI
ncbi:hypothetical protein DFH27DRAFT_529108 [Peziza echinospora]|nr:hypothetical protein DFH27DRAFT_529108 [Peziza echinospora]